MQKLSFRTKDYSNIYFSSDFHIDHQKEFVFGPRGFKTWEEHTKFIEAQINSLRKDDLLFFLGDFALNTTPERVQSLLDGITCETYMCFGNHNAGIKQSYRAARGINDDVDTFPIHLSQNVTLMGDAFYVSIDGNKFFCQHFAPLIWDGMQHGWPAIFGHSHGNLIHGNPETRNMGRMLDVGVDNAIKYNKTAFFSLLEVLDIIKTKEVLIYDHHE